MVSNLHCCAQLLNTVFDISVRSQVSNLANSGVQTDCPHRFDRPLLAAAQCLVLISVLCRERFGYGGDAAATTEAYMMNFDMAALNEKRVRDFNAGIGPCRAAVPVVLSRCS
jgi:alpha-L-rhamnosidase